MFWPQKAILKYFSCKDPNALRANTIFCSVFFFISYFGEKVVLALN
jgi:hypothetical protein